MLISFLILIGGSWNWLHSKEQTSKFYFNTNFLGENLNGGCQDRKTGHLCLFTWIKLLFGAGWIQPRFFGPQLSMHLLLCLEHNRRELRRADTVDLWSSLTDHWSANSYLGLEGALKPVEGCLSSFWLNIIKLWSLIFQLIPVSFPYDKK